ncbi:hypothetical protein GCM10007880_61190 [Mesorhizobium amorphae]|uniref:hypothetical protein n=1 Tax=Mesorhizobium amorphae TaxID=71433 RepID=UPI00235D010B|nr:hypothetical protein [Mesorhizobium amorphae]GLR45601.1 hypothetical protein GCM10007880_61190 [Mesorhizobium amorphae]
MPIIPDAAPSIRANLVRIQNSQKAPIIIIGSFTELQFTAINAGRASFKQPALEENEILFIGGHIYSSRSKDGYTIDDIVHQIVSALGEDAVAMITHKMTCTRNPTSRADAYGNFVNDRAVYEMTARKPRAELFSVIPKGDHKKPPKK